MHDVADEIRIECRITSGLNEGHKYITMKEYFQAIKKVLGIEPYPGTLNLTPKVDGARYEYLGVIKERATKIKDGFNKNGRYYGALWAKKALLEVCGRYLLVYIVIPEIDKHHDIIEVIAPFNLRKTYHLNDGDTVVLVIL